MGQCPDADVLLVASSACGIDVVTLKVDMTTDPRDITKKQFQRQITVPPYKQTLLHNTCVEGQRSTIDNCNRK